MKNLTEALESNTYPGRGILLGRSEDGNSAVLLYFIMGRSENSRNRVFVTTDDGIRTEAFDPAKMSDPSLIIYHPVRFFDNHVIVTNGDQTDTIWDGMKSDRGFIASLNTRTFEPDKPNYTPRISGLLRPDGTYALSILKSHDGNPDCCCRYFFDYETALPGVGHLIHTYQSDGDPIPSFEGEPKAVAMTGSLLDIADGAWRALNSDNKVSLYAFSKNLLTGETANMIYNKNA
ncbi:IMP cyclohydrolase [Oscillospiraceae bacterium CM]|nr:IMP cyclohydrolase [Oscillospiraceae bacterium CM]